jgi:hypothetical protein
MDRYTADDKVAESASLRRLRRNENKTRHARMLPICILS